METQTQAQIFLADQRGCSRIDYFQSNHCFNVGRYFDETRQPFGALRLLNDDLLKPGHGACMQVEQNTLVVVLPVVGGLEYKSDVGNGFLEAGQTQLFSLAKGMSYEIINPYHTEVINYVLFWLTDISPYFAPSIQQGQFDLRLKNELLPLADFSHDETGQQRLMRGFIGRYDGRREGSYQLAEPQSSGVFVFILSGAFEVQNRLLHERDGLALANVQNNTVDFEALSNDALLLVLEVPL